MEYAGLTGTTPDNVDIDDSEDIHGIDSDEMVGAMPRRQPPSQQEWLAIKPIFIDLYIEQGKALNEVQRLLLRDHNFRAT